MLKTTYKIEFKKSAYKEFEKLPKLVKIRVNDAIKILSISPFSDILNFKKLKAKENYYRIRIGDYRVVYSVFNDILVLRIIRLGHRKDIYKYF